MSALFLVRALIRFSGLHLGNLSTLIAKLNRYGTLPTSYFLQDSTSDMVMISSKGCHVVRVHREQKERQKSQHKH